MDYGFAPINSGSTFVANESATGNNRWLAPEMIKPPSGEPAVGPESEPADIFAFAMLAIEIFTGEKPFKEQGDLNVVDLIYHGERPGFPQNAESAGLTTQMYEFLQRCWDPEPTERPTTNVVVDTWAGLIKNNEYMRHLELPLTFS